MGEHDQDRVDIMEDVIHSRRSSRRFDERAIPEPILRRLVEAGVYAPSGSNAQNQRFLIIDDPAAVQAIGRARFVWPYPAKDQARIKERNPGGIIGFARALIVVFSDSAFTDSREIGEYHIWEALEIQNAAASMQNVLLLATAMGLASCWISAGEGMSCTRLLSGRRWRDVLRNYAIPESCKIQGIVALGYPVQTDEHGYPVGEKRHGVDYKEIRRAPVDRYLIGIRQNWNVPALSTRDRIILSVGGWMVRLMVRMTHGLDRRLSRVELRALRRIRETRP